MEEESFEKNLRDTVDTVDTVDTHTKSVSVQPGYPEPSLLDTTQHTKAVIELKGGKLC